MNNKKVIEQLFYQKHMAGKGHGVRTGRQLWWRYYAVKYRLILDPNKGSRQKNLTKKYFFAVSLTSVACRLSTLSGSTEFTRHKMEFISRLVFLWTGAYREFLLWEGGLNGRKLLFFLIRVQFFAWQFTAITDTVPAFHNTMYLSPWCAASLDADRVRVSWFAIPTATVTIRHCMWKIK